MGGRSRSASIYNTLSERIKTWEYSPGLRLTEEEICSEFSVSRSPVREALNSLVSSRLVVKEEHKGYMVRLIDLREVNELYDTRLVLELEVVRLLCEKGVDTTTLEELRQRWQAIGSKLPEVMDLSASEDELFHNRLAVAADNLVLTQMLADISQRIHFVRLSDITDPDRLERTCKDHLLLLTALEKQDLKASQEIMRQNILWGKEKVDSAIKEALFYAHHMA
ncbi:GntR family transcriptional regulator [Sphaerochaeta sp. PS]|uniref:GntR family transcriptional regulator n=1 Tax=Sphaerochaeta sp. PS TaxID=3076336 RepID=UPI0028A35CF6|nr:GntR family transcriptional regulator [Sphaerochaeta sp. PS]MDT4761653.1 GntR family transcriptional regulator [Sphaerochaeta sp. PS]